MSLDLSEDYKVFDGVEEVQVNFKRARVPHESRVKYALKEPIRIIESGGDWLLSGSECFWNLPVDECDEQPKEGDTIQQRNDDTTWTITDVTIETLGTRYRCLSKKEK